MVTVIGRFTFELNQGSLILTSVFDPGKLQTLTRLLP